MHPGGGIACELVPEDSVCTHHRAWGADVHRYLHPLADMTDDRYRKTGFARDLWTSVELIHRRHIAPHADLVICAHPFLVCSLLRAFTDLFMLIYLTPTPLAFVPEDDHHHVLAQLRLLSAHASTFIVAASPIYALHALYQAGACVQSVRPSSHYIRDRYRWHGEGDHSNLLFFWTFASISAAFLVTVQGFINEARSSGVPWLRDARVSSTEHLRKQGLVEGFVGWDFLAGVRCLVLLPWDLQLTAFPELYALGVPLLLPAPGYLAAYYGRALAAQGMNFWAVRPLFAGKLVGPWQELFPTEPWVRDAAGDDHGAALEAQAQLLCWLHASDFESFGHTIRFASVPELLWRAAGTPFEELQIISAAMHAEWAESWRAASAIYEAAVQQLFGDAPRGGGR